MADAMGYIMARLPKLANVLSSSRGSAAPLCGKAPPFPAKSHDYFSPAPRGRHSLPGGAGEVGWCSRTTERPSLSAQQAAKPQAMPH
jgi:hypothetical protein